MLERLKSGQVKDFAKFIAQFEKLIRQTLTGLEEEVSEMNQKQFQKLLTDLQNDQAKVFQTGVDSFLKEQAEIARFSMTQEIMDLKSTVDMRGTALNSFTKKEVFKKVLARPLSVNGDLLEPWIKDFTNKEIKRVSGVIRLGRSQGRTNQELVKQIIGTKSKKYKDGILETTRRNASTVVRTSVQHVASSAQMEVWEANKKVVSGYKFVATLDGDTSAQCRSLDGQKFDFGQGPIPPIHPNCRSRTIGVLNDKYSFLSEGRTRSGIGADGKANISANETYYDWLKKQDEKNIKDVLGEKRAKLFIDGGLTAERFRKLQFDKNFEPLTLAEMRRLEPKAFEKAGL